MAGAQNTSKAFRKAAAAALFLLVSTLLVACDGGDGGLSRADVEEVVREELANAPATAQPEPGLTSADVEEAIGAAMADMPQPESGLSQEDVERIVEAAIASIPTSQPGLTSTQVEDAIRAALAAMPQPESGLTPAEAEQIAHGVVASIPPKSAPADYTKVLHQQRHQPLRDPGARRHPRILQPGREHRGPVVGLHHRRERSGHWSSRRSPSWAGPEGLGRHRRQRVQLWAGHAVGHRGRQVGVLRVPEPGERRYRSRPHRCAGIQARLGRQTRRAAVCIRVAHLR